MLQEPDRSAPKARGDREVALSAQVHAVPFYRAHGFVPKGEEYLEAGIPHQAMKRRALELVVQRLAVGAVGREAALGVARALALAAARSSSACRSAG